ncbi:hypothetical protein PtA15_7A507 [Puccinia triticina]|uniref:SWIM-type domain-containing protein n=1 Tax=Puccinia triticina TaxID=208348 RepID=A0ABY7CPC8_9BASI|nr:uncharacterized protein PtA15_7A507 [Puccinia triticina]WAQ86778.1 hypothetical protein PtA15_7A507 [Puccinia triticina]
MANHVSFLIDSFTNPRARTYHIKFEPPIGFAEGRLVTCNCCYFTRSGSGCKHMFYLAQEYKYLVVKRAPGLHETRATIKINTDSDVEVINCSIKRSNSGLFSPGDTSNPK